MYIGERFDASPMPTPPISRAMLNVDEIGATAVPRALAVKRNAERTSSHFRP